MSGTKLLEVGQVLVDAARGALLDLVAVMVLAGEDGREAAARSRRGGEAAALSK